MKDAEGNFEIPALVAAAHELKAPLVLLRQLSLQLQNCDDASRCAEITRRIKLTSERSLRLVDGLSKTARLEDAMFELKPIMINGVVNEVVSEIQPLADALNQEIRVKSRRRSVVVGHLDLIRTVLLGLLDNSLMAGTAKNKIDISFSAGREQLVLSVRDHGQKIDRKVYRSIMSNLGHGAVGVPDRPLSSGLGLFVATRFATYMKGSLSAVCHRRGGMTFKVSLPLSRQLELF
ncbi:MAG: HAMP domain-containing histidine kinase [Candidatus Nomurabacteria bacterium]|jgi:two-component system sensor histidine kinase VanS|nr:HAMP domain-containing histidine kinase [Candidatus Nomurabacteria bacterium]